jgi:hypothetical protein
MVHAQGVVVSRATRALSAVTQTAPGGSRLCRTCEITSSQEAAYGHSYKRLVEAKDKYELAPWASIPISTRIAPGCTALATN